MTAFFVRQSLSHILRIALLGGCVALGGCSMDKLRGTGYTDDDWTQNLRQPEPSAGAPWGFSTKARQIESNLGID